MEAYRDHRTTKQNPEMNQYFSIDDLSVNRTVLGIMIREAKYILLRGSHSLPVHLFHTKCRYSLVIADKHCLYL